MIPPELKRPDMPRMRALRLASLAEAVTLATLVCVAVPLKYWGGDPRLVQLLGPLHGAAFLAYMVFLGRAVHPGGWKNWQVVVAVVAAFVPVAGFVHERLLAARMRAGATV
jgi:integral membrane protein